MPRTALALALVLAAPLSQAAVKQATPEGFILEQTYTIAAPPARAWAALGHPERWWPDAHTFSGSRANLSLSLEVGGCFCERWKDGSSQDGRVVMVRPEQLLRLDAALGPLQDLAVSGALSIALAAADGGTTATVTYRVSGTPAHALDKRAAFFDQALGLQFGNWAKYAADAKP